MIRKPLNVWRVYMDLLANFMGLVVLGGAALLIVIGGAMLHAAAGNAHRCDPSEVAQYDDGGGRNILDGSRYRQSGERGCDQRISYPVIRFEPSQFEITRDAYENSNGVAKFCRDLVDAVDHAEKHQTAKPRIEVVGHASEEYQGPMKGCGTGLARNASSRRPPELPKDFEFFAAEFMPNAWAEYKIKNHGSGVLEGADRLFCNAYVAHKRSVEIMRACIRFSQENKSHQPDFIEHALNDVTLVAEPQEHIAEPGGLCDGKNGGEQLACERTVSLRIVFPPKAREKPRQAALPQGPP